MQMCCMKSMNFTMCVSTIFYVINCTLKHNHFVMSCVCVMAFLCGSTLVKGPLLQVGTVAI